MKEYDLVIIGGGPGGMSAGVYASQMGLKTLLIEKDAFGGQIETTSSVSNYLGFSNISGHELSEKMHEHLKSTNVEVINAEVTNVDLLSDEKIISNHTETYKCKAVIIAIGTSVRNLGVENERKYIGRGVSYSTLKDKDKYAGKNVAVVGGGNSALEDALLLSKTAKHVYVVHRRNEFRADAKVVGDLVSAMEQNHNISLVLDSKPLALIGDDVISGLQVLHIPDGETRELPVECVFVCIGRNASTEILGNAVARDDNGYIITDEKMQTNLQGVYAVGDIRNTPLRQIVTAVADGAIAAVSAFNCIKNAKPKIN